MDYSNFGDIGKTIRGGEQDAVVHDGNSRFLRAVDTTQDFAPRQHAAAAMNDKRYIDSFAQTECSARRKDEIELLTAGEFRERLGNLHRADIIALAMVRAALGYKDSIAILEILDRRDAFQKLSKIALLPRKENRERSQANIVPLNRATNLAKRLGVSDD